MGKFLIMFLLFGCSSQLTSLEKRLEESRKKVASIKKDLDDPDSGPRNGVRMLDVPFPKNNGNIEKSL